ncbi:hypothetical protein QAD02_023400 [Eretmocerus hayati]|uniref:Uncharacterized protein n=1 Tax=Eretmocerus hayati TaxID=131215 RepID=A0ACC2PVP6_9HYME|nr:hypothetical protein QAD02_023400 [Eretmocerus hayati]
MHLRSFVVSALLSTICAGSTDLDINIRSSNRLQKANPVRIVEAPYQVSLQSLGIHSCSGSIIGKRHVLTAGRCVYDESPSTLTVRAGTNVRQVGGSEHYVTRIHLHPDFRILENGYVLNTGHVSPAVGKIVRISGWGEVQGGFKTGLLHGFSVPVLENSFCERALNLTKDYMNRKVCSGFLISKESKTCHLDVGAPLFWNNSYYPPKVIGIVSRRFGGPSCHDEPDMQISGSPAYYHEWILSIIYA